MNIPSEAHIQAQIKGNKLTVQKENVVAYSIDLTNMPYDKKKSLKVIDNGLQVFNGMTSDSVLHLGVQPKSDEKLKNNRIAGPLAHVFSQRFILVKGTSGSRLETEGIKALSDTINKYWYNRYFTNCITKNDFEISEKDIENSNLVLLGNPASNLLLKRFQNDISLLVTNTGIQIKDKKVEGEKLCFYMVYPNPINKNRYIAVMGYNNAEFISLGAETSDSFNDVSNYGWYDYKVWKADNAMYTLSSGYFDSHWQN